jgi:hypothetical protein
MADDCLVSLWYHCGDLGTAKLPDKLQALSRLLVRRLR